jgi:SPP1 family predicted phage head-tail adaptor
VKAYQCGKLRQVVTLQNPGPETFDSFRQPVPSWTTIGVFSAQVRPLSGREAIVAKQVKAEASHMITMRYLGPSVVINPTSRLLYGSRVFGIVQVINVEERHRWYEIVAQEIQQSGGV